MESDSLPHRLSKIVEGIVLFRHRPAQRAAKRTVPWSHHPSCNIHGTTVGCQPRLHSPFRKGRKSHPTLATRAAGSDGTHPIIWAGSVDAVAAQAARQTSQPDASEWLWGVHALDLLCHGLFEMSRLLWGWSCLLTAVALLSRSWSWQLSPTMSRVQATSSLQQQLLAATLTTAKMEVPFCLGLGGGSPHGRHGRKHWQWFSSPTLSLCPGYQNH